MLEPVRVRASILSRACAKASEATSTSSYTCVYESFICLGELLRNLCVNLGFDKVEQSNGIVLNADVFIVREELGGHRRLVLLEGYDAKTKLFELSATWRVEGDSSFMSIAFRPHEE